MSKSPPYIVNHPEDGSFRIGKEEDGKAVRKAQICAAAGSAASLRIFEDGGWELRATEMTKVLTSFRLVLVLSISSLMVT